MRVMLLVNQFPPFDTSAARLYGDLAEDLAAAGHAVTVVTSPPRDGLPPGWTEPGGATVVRVAARPLARHVPLLRAFEQFWTALRYALAARGLGRHDAILVYSPPLPLGLAARWLARRRGARWVLNVQDLYPKTAIDLGLLRGRAAIALARWLERSLYASADALVLHSDGNVAHVVGQGVPAARAHRIHNWVDFDRLAAGSPGPVRERHELGDRFVCFYGGNMGFAQGLDDVLDAAAELRDDPRFLFLLVGDGAVRPALERRARDEGLGNVRFLKTVPEVEYNALVHAADLPLVTLTRALASPVVPGKLQAILASGKAPLVSTHPASDARTMVAEAGAGVWVEAGRAGALAAAIVDLAGRADELGPMGERGRAYAEARFRRGDCTGAFVRLLEDLVAGGVRAEVVACEPAAGGAEA